MSSPGYAATIDLALRPSGLAHRWLFVLHAIPLGVMPFALEPSWLMALIAALMAGSWTWLRRHPVFGYGPKALIHLIWHAEGGWTLEDAAGLRHDAELRGDSLVHPALLVLNFQLKDGARRTRILVGDEVQMELMRRLRARLSIYRVEHAK